MSGYYERVSNENLRSFYMNGNSIVRITENGSMFRSYYKNDTGKIIPKPDFPDLLRISFDSKCPNCLNGCINKNSCRSNTDKNKLAKLASILDSVPEDIYIEFSGKNILLNEDRMQFIAEQKRFVRNIITTNHEIMELKKEIHTTDISCTGIKIMSIPFGIEKKFDDNNFDLLDIYFDIKFIEDNYLDNLINVKYHNKISIIFVIGKHDFYEFYNFVNTYPEIKVYIKGNYYDIDDNDDNIIEWKENLSFLLSNQILSFDDKAVDQLQILSFIQNNIEDAANIAETFIPQSTFEAFIDVQNEIIKRTEKSDSYCSFDDFLVHRYTDNDRYYKDWFSITKL